MLICIDPGHGGRDPGAIGPTELHEADVALGIARRVYGDLLGYDHTVMMTRPIDVYVGLETRAAIANDAGADLFLSLHANAFTSPSAHGTETLYHPASEASQAWAQYVQAAAVARGGRRDRGIKERGDLCVLRETAMTAVLVEVAFISHPEEERLLRSHVWLGSVAEGIVQGTVDYLESG